MILLEGYALAPEWVVTWTSPSGEQGYCMIANEDRTLDLKDIVQRLVKSFCDSGYDATYMESQEAFVGDDPNAAWEAAQEEGGKS